MGRKNVLLLGDSISLGYRERIRNALKNEFRVVFPKEQGKSAADIYRMLYEWSRDLVSDSNDVRLVYWNAGLWDVVNIFDEGNNTDIDVYKDYLYRTYNRIKKIFPNALICFGTTTPVLENRYKSDFYRTNKEIERYNEAAKEILFEQVDLYDDLYSLVEGTEAEEYVDATHFGNNINQKLANHICKEIKRLLSDEIENYQGIYKILENKKKNLLETINEKRRLSIVAWGAGNIFSEFHRVFSEYCDIRVVIDRDKRLQGSVVQGYRCVSADEIPDGVELVVSTIDNTDAIMEIQDYCLDKEILCCTYAELLEYIWPLYERKILLLQQPDFIDADPNGQYVMSKYIGISIPENVCNLDCSYCYLQLIPYRRSIDIKRKNPHLSEFIRWRLSRETLGGSCLIGLTGSGETFFADGFEEVCLELLREGHYLHIVTNGVLTEKVDSLIKNAGEYARHIIFKLSFHYLQLLRRNKLQEFVQTVRVIENSLASYTIEVMPHDELVPYIPDVLEFSEENFGAYPQLTIGRNEREGAKLLTKLNHTEFYNTWKIFNSDMFDMRMQLYMTKGKKCKAGEKSLFLDLYTGRVNRCIFPENIGNIYYDGIENMDIVKVGDYCPMNYCFNCHVYATLGVLPIPDTPSYMTIRDRVRTDGRHWIKEDMRRYLDIKL